VSILGWLLGLLLRALGAIAAESESEPTGLHHVGWRK
jgi:hypothetical protein